MFSGQMVGHGLSSTNGWKPPNPTGWYWSLNGTACLPRMLNKIIFFACERVTAREPGTFNGGGDPAAKIQSHPSKVRSMTFGMLYGLLSLFAAGLFVS